MKRLSKPITELKPMYDVVVVGSGYGGSIAASRLSRAGLGVALLEKGKEFQPGEFPDTLVEAEREMQLNTDKRRAQGNGLYEFHVSEDISVFKGCGLGGTSLVNANVSIKPEPRVFEDPRWPAALREDLAGLEEGYALARAMLRPARYPENQDGYPELKKTQAMREAARAMGYPFELAELNITFRDGVNQAGVAQARCVNCGDCVTGCNHRAKNNLIMNYLPDAVNHGAEIFCNAAVEYVEQAGDEWLVYFQPHHCDREKFQAPMMFVRARMVVLAGGTLGSTEILLRSREKGLALSPELGKRFTGNGDVLGFSYNCEKTIDGMGLGKHWDDPDRGPVGPCITSVIDMRYQERLEDGITFEEGSIPAPIASVVNMSMLALSPLTGEDTDHGLRDWLEEAARSAESLVRGPYHGAVNRMQTYLVMTHDDGNGRLDLQNGCLNISWKDVGMQPIFRKVDQALRSATVALKGTYIPNVLWNKFFHYDLVTVHPLGGCCMGEDAASGVTDHTGQVFRGDTGAETYPGLYVMDGSIVPLPLGTNPLLTISALSERACRLIARSLDRSISYSDDTPAEAPGRPWPLGVQFTETMKGYFCRGEKDDYLAGYTRGCEQRSVCLFTLTIQTGDIDAFLADPAHQGTMAGTVIAPVLSERPLMVSQGIFNLFVADPADPGMLKMNYSMRLHSKEGRVYYFSGYKAVRDDRGFDLWKDTTELFVTLYEGEDATAPVIGKGLLKIAPQDFAIQMTTMKAVNAANKLEGLQALKKFGGFFSSQVLETYFSKLF